MTEQMAIENIKAFRDSEEIYEYVYADEFIESFDMAIKALEKQIPKKPKGIDNDICPNCGTYNSVIPQRRNTVGCDTVYCWHCGTAIECEV